MPSLPISVVPAYFETSMRCWSCSLIAADVTERVHAHARVRIEPRKPRTDLDAREVGSMHREAREFLFGQLQADWHGVERAPCHDRAPGPRHVFGRQQAERHEPGQRVVDVGGLLAREFQLIRRSIECEGFACAIEQEAARGRDRFDADAVALRQFAEVVVPDHLQVEEAGKQRAEQHHDDERGGDDAPAEHALFGVMILEPGVAGHRAPALRKSGA